MLRDCGVVLIWAVVTFWVACVAAAIVLAPLVFVFWLLGAFS